MLTLIMQKQYELPGYLSESDGPQLRNSERQRPPSKAAVLINLLHHSNQWHVLFIKRAEREGDYHSGQVAFPGGKHEEADSSIRHTALREAQEEIGLHPGHVEVLGSLDTYTTISNFQIYPFVSLVPWPTELTPQVSEVAKIFTIPLSWLADEKNYSLKTPHMRHPSVPLNSDRPQAVYFEHYDGELLWGATARMTLSLLQALDKGKIVIE